MPLCVSCPRPKLRLYSSAAGYPVPSSHCLSWGRLHPCGQACPWELALHAVKAERGRPAGGRLLPGCGASRVGRSPTASRPSLGRAARARYPLAVGAGGMGVETPHQPHSVRSCVLALRVVGAARGRREGALLVWVWGVRGWAIFHARLPVLGACGPDPLPTGCACAGMGAGPVTNPTAHVLRAGFARCRGGMRAPGRRVPLAWLWGVCGWAISHAPPPVLGACGLAPLPAGCGCGGCGRGDPSPTPQRALLRAGFARCGGGTRAPGGGSASCLGIGRPGLGALARATTCPWNVRRGPTTHWL